MQTYSAVIVDDEKTSINLIKYFINKYIPNIHIVGLADTVDNGKKIINHYKPDICVLDIQLKNKNVFELLDQIDYSETEIIFITAFSEYALKAFKYNAIDYIMKPISIEDLTTAFEKCIQRIEERKLFEQSTHSTQNHNSNQKNDTISIVSTDKVDTIKKADILFCKSDGRYTTFYLKNNRQIVASKNLGEYEQLFANDYFFRIHHSYIVNLDNLMLISKKENNYFCDMINNYSLPIAKRRIESLRVFMKMNK
ncbi:LytR/AlgR family response regulator transcription factor [Paenimyroides aestuarii]|uniref:LytTR family DNA-binding domain-containing protein n=1 Tax=Paenimyroides aestuarii TaxID=2968490 RepID=A0ABY5NUU3_9FLAO|nr:LytTR family DNA-binding domain-containing protein [Paenimyroides aestuarii]UUV22356.1 LytTR family DNA-binding domain-containing protein [Paenimyroides aestuarii]